LWRFLAIECQLVTEYLSRYELVKR
jgi:hypothetical protein